MAATLMAREAEGLVDCWKGAATKSTGMHDMGTLMDGKEDCGYCDNEAVVEMLGTGYNREPNLMHLLRYIYSWLLPLMNCQ